ncbi:eukaryotic translation initiation factor 4G1, eIF4E-binding domain-containing protein [Trametes maxima]|nr:eukaryotic translation initiation factor 4G1, eIF4E-binding domain-containing protein [Trametes maxima]
MQPPPSAQTAFSAARPIEDFDGVKYPPGIRGPKPELNMDAKPTKFRYDRDFLLQFRDVCKETPGPSLPLEALGLLRECDVGPEKLFYFARLRIANPLSPKPVAHPDTSANSGPIARIARNRRRKGRPASQGSPEIVQRKIRALLNLLTPKRFDLISNQIIALISKSEEERDGRTLNQVARLVLEKAADEGTWPEI